MAKRQTREEREAAVQAERVKQFRDRFEEERGRIVVESPSDAYRKLTEDLAGDASSRIVASLVYETVSRVEHAWARLRDQVAWLRSATDTAERYVAERRSYGSALVGARGSDVDAAAAALHEAIEAARPVLRAFNVHSPLIHDARAEERRTFRLRFAVAFDPRRSGWFILVDGQPLTLGSAPKGLMTPAPLPTGALPTLYGTEDAAWIALAVILGESI